MDMNRLGDEVDRNYDAFIEQLPSLLKAHRDEYALLRDQKALDFFPTAGQALAAGREKFADGIYSVQEITDRPIDLGFFSHAVHSRIA